MAVIPTVRKGVRILIERLRTQGVKLTLIWLYARVLPKFMGVPVLKYSRITPQIFVGTQYRMAGRRRLEKLGIRNSINMRIEFDDQAHGLDLANHCYLPTVDDYAPSIDQLHEGIEFIKDVVSRGEAVYIHCAGGIGRAPTMTAAYLMSQGLSMEEAIEKIKKARPFIKIMPDQIRQLRRWEKLLCEGQAKPVSQPT